MRRAKDMGWFQKTFIATGAGLAFGTIVTVGMLASKSSWSEFTFVTAYVVCVILSIQFVLRYIAIATLHQTEIPPSAWALSLVILIVSLVLVAVVHSPRWWFLALGMLLIFAALKNIQTRHEIRTKTGSNDEKLKRLRESMIMEASFGILMLLFSGLSEWGTHVSSIATPASATFFGVVVAAFYTAMSTVVFVFRLRSDDAIFRELVG